MNKIISLGLFLGLILVSCKEPNVIGLEVQPESELIIISSANFADFNSKTESEDSLVTDQAKALLLGEINDNVFGKNEGAFYTQLLLAENNIDLGDNPEVDSVILTYSLATNDQTDVVEYYGNLNQGDFSLDVFVIQEPLYKDTTYYSSSFPVAFGNGNSYIDSDTEPEICLTTDSILRVKLNNNFGKIFLEDLGTELLSDNETLLESFNGISVHASAQNTMLYLDPEGVNSALKIYYHNDQSGLDTVSLDFDLGGDAVRVNLFNEKNQDNIIEDTSKIYLQSMSGYKAKVNFGNLDLLKDSLEMKVINKVMVAFSVEESTDLEYEPHQKLVLVRVNAAGDNVFLSDFILEGEAYFGGNLENDGYEFNITRYFYQLLNNPSYTNELYLMPAGAATNANRTILKKEIKLEIHYSEL